MARVTVEDCLEHVENRFELVMLAAKRARQLALGRSEPTVPWGSDKCTVVALREIAAGNLTRQMVDAIDEGHEEQGFPIAAVAEKEEHVE